MEVDNLLDNLHVQELIEALSGAGKKEKVFFVVHLNAGDVPADCVTGCFVMRKVRIVRDFGGVNLNFDIVPSENTIFLNDKGNR